MTLDAFAVRVGNTSKTFVYLYEIDLLDFILVRVYFLSFVPTFADAPPHPSTLHCAKSNKQICLADDDVSSLCYVPKSEPPLHCQGLFMPSQSI